MRSDPVPIAALDVGGMSVKRGLVVDPGTVDLVPATPLDATADRETVLTRLADAARGVLPTDGPLHLAVAFPDPFDYPAGVPLLRGQHKFDAIHGVALRPELVARLGVRPPGALTTTFWHDAESAAVGEARFGAGAGVRRTLVVTLGTGFGSALVDAGAPVAEVDGVAVRHLYREPVDARGRADDVLSARGLAEELGCAPHDVADRAARGVRLDRFASFGEHLHRFVTGWAGRLGADRVVVGGGVAAAFDLLAAGFDPSGTVEVRPASLGPAAPLLGVAALHRDAISDAGAGPSAPASSR